jgi:hypothetical protein
MKNFQFTFKIRDLNQARFWYISLVACTRDASNSCEWHDLSEYELISSHISTHSNSSTTHSTSYALNYDREQFSYRLAYDIWLVNGNPNSPLKNHFEHQFTYELHDIFEIYLSSLIIYLFIMPFVIYRLYWHYHRLYLLLIVYIGIEATARLLSLIHNLIFSFDGNGLYAFELISNLMEALASSFLILILLVIAKGWTVRKSIKISQKFFALGLLLQFVLVFSHMIALVNNLISTFIFILFYFLFLEIQILID